MEPCDIGTLWYKNQDSLQIYAEVHGYLISWFLKTCCPWVYLIFPIGLYKDNYFLGRLRKEKLSIGAKLLTKKENAWQTNRRTDRKYRDVLYYILLLYISVLNCWSLGQKKWSDTRGWVCELVKDKQVYKVLDID